MPKNYLIVATLLSIVVLNANAIEASPANIPGLAKISESQKLKIADALKKNTPKKLESKIKEASEVIQLFIERSSCMNEGQRALNSTLNIYAAPGSDFTYVGDGPAVHLKYHDKNTCMSVSRINFSAKQPASNALRFETLYVSDSSGETEIHNHVVVRQTDGSWLFRE